MYGFSGVVSDLYDPEIEIENFSSPYGILAGVNETNGLLNIFYLRDPVTLIDENSELEVASRWDTALKFYVIGHALRDDLDTSFRTLGNEALQFYLQELALAKKSDSTDSTRATQYEVTYRSPF